MRPSCSVDKKMSEIGNERSMKVQTNYDCNYVDYKYTMLATIQYCDNWLHHLCQN